MREDHKVKKQKRKSLVRTGRRLATVRDRFSPFNAFGTGEWFRLSGSLLQFLLGMAVVAASIVGLIQPLWLGTLFTVLASFNVMIAVAGLYHLFTSDRYNGSLVSRAIRRAVRSQN